MNFTFTFDLFRIEKWMVDKNSILCKNRNCNSIQNFNKITNTWYSKYLFKKLYYILILKLGYYNYVIINKYNIKIRGL